MSIPHVLALYGFAAAFALAGGPPSPITQGASARASSRSFGEIKARIEADNRNHPSVSVTLAKDALAAQPDIPQRLWFLASLSRDLIALGEPRQALAFAREGQGLLNADAKPKERVRFGVLVARALLLTDDFQRASKEIELLLPLLPALSSTADPEDKTLSGSAFRVLGSIALNQAKLSVATDHYTKALRLYDQAGDARGQALVYDALGSVDSQTRNYERAEFSIKKAIALAEGLKDQGLQAGFHLSLANLYGRIENLDKQASEYAITHQLATQSGDDSTALTATVNLADLHLRLKDYPATLKHAEEALELAAKAHDASSVAVSQINKGIALNRLGKPAEGYRFIQLGLDYFKKVGANSYITEIMGIFAEEYAHNREFEKAYQAHVEFKKLNDQILRLEDQKRMAETNTAYQSEKKQREIEALQKERLNQARFRNLWILAGLLGLSTAFILVLGRRKLTSANRALEDMSLKDPLTGLANRRYLTTRIDEDLAQIRRVHRTETTQKDRLAANIDVVFMMLDLDHFKQVNDQYGHAAGDEILKQVANILARTLRDSDTVVRWGGEEFFVLAKNTSRADVHILVERLRHAIATFPFEVGQAEPIHKTCSIGFALYPFLPGLDPATPWETVTEMADQCLYAAKASGRDMWVGIHSEGLPEDNACLGPQSAWVDVADSVRAGRLQVIASPGRDIRWPE